MTRNEIISMAREAGIEVHERKQQARIGMDALLGADSTEKLERFAALVTAAEREACAKECERLAEEFAELAQTAEVDEAGRHGYSHAGSAAVGCAAAIRMRRTAT